MENNISFLTPFMINALRYIIFAGVPFLIFYILFPQRFKTIKIQNRIARNIDFVRELLHSAQTMIIIAIVLVFIQFSYFQNRTLIYTDINEQPIWWLPVSIILCLVIHDTYFYWMHRMLHHPKLYRKIHFVHHQSSNPTPLASYSFGFLEAILEAMIAPLLMIVLPLHPIALIVFGFMSFGMNVYGHLGYEIAPKWFRDSFLFQILNTSTHHNMHHERSRGNYGLYFRFWDRTMGTEISDYKQCFESVVAHR